LFVTYAGADFDIQSRNILEHVPIAALVAVDPSVLLVALSAPFHAVDTLHHAIGVLDHLQTRGAQIDTSAFKALAAETE
jgi:hypothetical protein